MLLVPTVLSLLLGAQGGFYTEGRLVLVNASVFDNENRFHAGLRNENFQLLDDGAEMQLRSVAVEEVPLSTVILLDVSRSMEKSIEQARIALERYLDKARSGDEYCLIAFSDRVPAGCEYLTDAAEVRARAASALTGGGTALVDALHTALAMAKRAHNQRRAILVLSDGLDNSSGRRWKTIQREALESTAAIYAVGLPVWEMDSWQTLRLAELAKETGGRMVAVRSARELPAALEGLEVRLQYVLAFVPPGDDSKPQHRVRVRLRGEAAQHLRVYWRHNYSTRVQ